MVTQNDNGQELHEPDDGAVMLNLEMAILQVSSQVQALAFIHLKQQAAALLQAGMDPRRFVIQAANTPPAVQIQLQGNIVKATNAAPVPQNLRFDPNG